MLFLILDQARSSLRIISEATTLVLAFECLDEFVQLLVVDPDARVRLLPLVYLVLVEVLIVGLLRAAAAKAGEGLPKGSLCQWVHF